LKESKQKGGVSNIGSQANGEHDAGVGMFEEESNRPKRGSAILPSHRKKRE